MALPVTIPNQFANATSSIPLSQLDTNFNTLSNAVNGINSGAETLANLVATTANVTTGNITTVNATTVDTTNIEVTNIKAKDGTASATIADSTGVMTIASSVLTTTDINGGTLDNVVIGGATANAATFTSITDSGNLTFTGTGNRITGDFSNATVANRVMVKTSTTNGGTILGLMPDGTGNASNYYAFRGSDTANTEYARVGATGGSVMIVESGITGTGTYLPMTFFTGGSERMRIDTSGNVGIGTSSPELKLSVNSGTDGAAAFITNTSGGVLGGTGLRFRNANTTNNCAFQLVNQDSTSTTNASIDFINVNATGGSGSRTGAIAFATSNSGTIAERMRIDTSGNLLVGTTSTGGGKCVIEDTSANQLVLSNKDTGSASQYACYFLRNNSIVGSIQTTNTATTYVTSSDYRLKENIAPMTGALATVAQLNPVTYTWKADGSAGQGFIAHELQAVCPDAVTGEKDGEQMQGVDYGKLTPILTAALQEAIAKIEILETRIAVLEAK